MQVDGISGKLTPETLEELEEILVLSDVGVHTAGRICSDLAARVGRRSLGTGSFAGSCGRFWWSFFPRTRGWTWTTSPP